MNKSRAFRDALGRYPTGVTLVTTFRGGVAMGMTVNSFASVSLDPMLVLWSVDKASERYEIFRDATDYAINVLAHDQSDWASLCAQNPDLKANHVAWSGEAAPLISNAVARFTCRRHAVYSGGDHDIIVGEIVAMDTPRDVPALEFYRGGYSSAG
ncbi:flavin reductase family protein [Maricaulis sp.]|uniref:flavin reductase family protein n=1 Tax=Maricaulis sp. TaxID=1486257 RepID=UPI0026063611|nr:flavin reductase family protein [Maricaulis sp.]